MSSTNVLLRESWRQLALATVVTLTLAAGISSAQTVIVKNAPPGSSVEVVLNQDATGVTSDVDTSGVATVVIGLFKDPAKLETDAQIFMDVCDKKRRILIAERGVLAVPPEKGCNRTDMGGWFLLKPVSSAADRCGRTKPDASLEARARQPEPVNDLERCADRRRVVRGRRVHEHQRRAAPDVRDRGQLFGRQ